jgi:hypothetical protein
MCLALVAACANLPTLGSVCGNGVLEPGEDCDTPDNSQCQMCGWRCGTSGDCSAIPAPKRGEDYACGVDGFCHAPGGALAPESAAPVIQASRIYETDVNGDGYGDVVGVASASLDTLYGDGSAQLAQSALTATAGADGAVSIADLGYGKLDAVYPTRDGLAAYASPFGALLPLPFATEVENTMITPLALVPLDGTHVVALFVTSGSAVLQAAVVDLSAAVPQPLAITLCDDYTAASFDAAALDAYDITVDPSIPSVAFAFVATNATGASQLCTMQVLETAGGSTSCGAGALTCAATAVAAPPSRAVLAQLDTSTCPSLVVPTGSGFVRYGATRATTPASACAYASVATALPTLGAPGDTLVGHLPLAPALANPLLPSELLAGDALVLASGVYGIGVDGAGAADPTQPAAMLYAADRPLVEVAAGDVNADGQIDGVALGNDATIDVLYRDGSAGFVRGRLAAGSQPAHLVVADLDGNGAADIAYSEQTANGTAIAIVHDTTAGPLPAVVASELASAASMVRLALPDSADPSGAIAGLAVAIGTPVTGSVSLAAAFHGSVDRMLVPFVDPRGPGAASSFRAVITGHFVDNSSAVGGVGVDLLAIEVPDDTTATASLWQLTGGAVGGFYYPSVALDFQVATGSAALAIGGPVVDCGAGGSDMASDGSPLFCIDGSRLVDWTLRPDDASDDLFAIDADHGSVFDVAPCAYTFALGSGSGSGCPGAGSGSAQQVTCSGVCLPPHTTLVEAFAADLDGDGSKNELVLAYTTATRAGVLACKVHGGSNTMTCTDLGSAVGATASCTDVVVGRFSLPSSAAGSELEMVCGATVYRITTTTNAASALLFASSVLTTLPLAAGSAFTLAAGDVNGDRVDDLLVVATDAEGTRRVHVFPQLTSRQAAAP